MQQRAGTKGAIGSILTRLDRRINRDRKTPIVIRLDADKQLCQLPESGQKKASFAHWRGGRADRSWHELTESDR
jgi:hypothetical protein